jgi:putative ubiquitin-RnfH superfamily antitoxin RatB of RatAB toxin-antitoxin module
MVRVDRDGEGATLRVAVACSPQAGAAFEVELRLQAPATAWDAVRASGVLDRWPELAAIEPSIGVWGRVVSADATLREGDRVEAPARREAGRRKTVVRG